MKLFSHTIKQIQHHHMINSILIPPKIISYLTYEHTITIIYNPSKLLFPTPLILHILIVTILTTQLQAPQINLILIRIIPLHISVVKALLLLILVVIVPKILTTQNNYLLESPLGIKLPLLTSKILCVMLIINLNILSMTFPNILHMINYLLLSLLLFLLSLLPRIL